MSTAISAVTLDALLDALADRIAARVVPPTTDDDFIDTAEAADMMGIKENTAEINRTKGIGPKYYKIGRKVRYKRRDVRLYVEECKRSSTSAPVKGRK